MHRILFFILCLFLLILSVQAFSQERVSVPADKPVPVEINDTIYRWLEQIDVYPRKGININYRRYSRLVKKIKKVYPVAKEAATELQKYKKFYEKDPSGREKRKYVKKVEKELFARHEDELKHFTASEGRYLMLLIDRETGETSYTVIDEVKGTVPAVFWQGLARLFGNNLKEPYDPVYKHFVIEQIVLMIQKGEV